MKKPLKKNAKSTIFFNTLLFKEQFKTEKQLLWHFQNLCAPLLNEGEFNRYLKDTKPYYDEGLLSQIQRKYILPDSRNIYTGPACFTKVVGEIFAEDLRFCKDHKIKRNELTYLLGRITGKIWKSENRKCSLVYEYFLRKKACGEDFPTTYSKKTGRKVYKNKLCHMLQVLVKYDLLYRTPTRNGRSYIYMIGRYNPYYLLREVPDVPENTQKETGTDKKVKNMSAENIMLKEALQSERTNHDVTMEELSEAKHIIKQNEDLLEQREKIINLLSDEVLEKEQRIKQLQSELEHCKLLQVTDVPQKT